MLLKLSFAKGINFLISFNCHYTLHMVKFDIKINIYYKLCKVTI